MAGPKVRAFRARLLLGALDRVARAGARLSLRRAQRLGAMLGGLAWHVARKERRKALANVAIAFPEWTESKRRSTIKAMFRHLGTSLMELIWLPNLITEGYQKTTTVEGHERLVELVQQGHSVVAYTGHCGNWEWVAYIMRMLGLPLTVLQRERNEEQANEFITTVRSKAGIRTIDRGSVSSAREMLQALKKPGLMAFLIDQNIRTESVKVPFFGRPALTPVGPAKLNIRMELAAVPIFIARNADGTHHARVLEPIFTKKGDDPVVLTARITELIEEQIRAHPEQWVWMHDRWRERPKWDVGESPGE